MAVAPVPDRHWQPSEEFLRRLLEHGDSRRSRAAGWTLILLAVDDWMLERLLAFGPRHRGP
jgi:hypothetical protein